jgi:signal transduction histidine kinase
VEIQSDLPRADAERMAGIVFAYRQEILDRWCELIEIEQTEPAAGFIRSQLDASIHALANWFLGVDPVESTMGRQWSGITPTSEMTIGAVISMGVMPDAIRDIVEPVEPDDFRPLTNGTRTFVAMMTHRLLAWLDLDFSDERWTRIAQDVRETYEQQRIQRVARLGALIEISHAVSVSQDLEALFEAIANSIMNVSGSDYIEISLMDPMLQKLRCHVVVSQGRRQEALEQTIIEFGLANEVLSDGKALVVQDYQRGCEERGIPPSSALTPGPQRAWMGAPMTRGGDISGVIAVSGRLSTYDPEDVELLAAIARQTAVALDNRRLIDAQQRHLAQLQAVNDLARETAQLRDPGELTEVAAKRIQETFDFGLVTVFRAASDSDYLTMVARHPVPVEQEAEVRHLAIGPGSIVGVVAQNKSPALICDVRKAPDYLASTSTSNTRSEMAVPIVHAGTLLGVLDVQSDSIGAFDRHDLTTLQTIADQLAVGLENSRLFEEEARRTRQLELMLETSRAASSSLLLDEVLEQLARGLATAANTTDCLIHIYVPEDNCFDPAAFSLNDPEGDSCLFQSWNHRLSIDDHPDLGQLLRDRSPQLICPIDTSCRSMDHAGGHTPVPPVILIPLRTRQRTLGLAIVPCTCPADSVYPLERIRLLQGVADSAALAVENARLYAQAHGLAISEERGRLAQEIHDTLAQGLTAISLQLDLADSYLPHEPEKAGRNVQRALDLTRDNLDQARRSVLDLRAADVHHMSLPDAVTRLVRRLEEDSDIRFRIASEGLTSRLSARIEVGLYRIIEEALENARQHSQANDVRIELVADGKTVRLLVDDDGTGFDPAEIGQRNTDSGFGLLGIRERARLLGGSLTITSAPDSGTNLSVVVPYEARMQSATLSETGEGEQK